MTLNGVVAIILRYFREIGSVPGALCKWLKIFPNFLRQECSPKLLIFSDISLMMICCREPLYRGVLNARGVAKYTDFGHIEGYISETVQDRK